MSLTLYAHPFSSYSQKVLTALYENEVEFDYRHLEHPNASDELAALWPLGRFPVLVDGGQTVAESSIIIEHVGHYHASRTPLVPADPAEALNVRFLDRFFDNFILNETLKPIGEAGRVEGGRTDQALREARSNLETAYAWLEGVLPGRTWATGAAFTLADCAAAPSLFYSDWVHPIGEQYPHLRAYRSRLLARPSFARAVEEGRPYRSYFPFGAPDWD